MVRAIFTPILIRNHKVVGFLWFSGLFTAKMLLAMWQCLDIVSVVTKGAQAKPIDRRWTGGFPMLHLGSYPQTNPKRKGYAQNKIYTGSKVQCDSD
jgi:hypothetical protein